MRVSLGAVESTIDGLRILFARELEEIHELSLDQPRPICFNGCEVAVAEMLRACSRGDWPSVRIGGSRPQLDLFGAAAEDAAFLHARVFVLRGTPVRDFLIFGGETLYRLDLDGPIVAMFPTHRRNDLAKYHRTEFLQIDGETVVVYESGLSGLTDELEVRVHVPKCVNDFLRGVEPGALRFERDQDEFWSLRLADGTSPEPWAIATP